MKKRVVIVDDHPIVRQGFKQLIDAVPDLEVVGEADDAATALSLIASELPDLALVDLSLKDRSGLELIKDMRKSYPSVLILVVSLHDENVYAERAIRAGARGFVMKAEAVDNIIVAIRQIFNGGVYLSSKMRSRIVEKVAGLKTPSDESILHTLSDREFEIFQLVGKGYKTSSIASTLNLSIKTVETYKSHIKQKLKLKDATELMQNAIEWSFNSQALKEKDGQ